MIFPRDDDYKREDLEEISMNYGNRILVRILVPCSPGKEQGCYFPVVSTQQFSQGLLDFSCIFKTMKQANDWELENNF